MKQFEINGNSVGFPGLSRPTINELAAAKLLEFPRINLNYGVFIPSFDISGKRHVIRRTDGQAVSYKHLQACRDYICKLTGCREVDIKETSEGNTGE